MDSGLVETKGRPHVGGGLGKHGANRLAPNLQDRSIDHSGYPTFIVNHLKKPVTHPSEIFPFRNLDFLDPGLPLPRGSSADSFGGTEAAGLMNQSVEGLFLRKCYCNPGTSQ